MQAEPAAPAVVYPDSDGQPMADNTLQYEWIVTIKGNLDVAIPDFVGGDLLWYPVKGDPKTRIAPDALVAFGRPKGHRGSYKQWEEDGIAPQVVWEVLSPGNRPTEMTRKRLFYEKYGVNEYYVYDPDRERLEGWLRQDDRLVAVDDMQGFVSPRLKVRFELTDTLHLFRPDGTEFLSFAELEEERQAARVEAKTARAEAGLAKTEAKTARAEAGLAKTEAKTARAEAELAKIEAKAARAKAELAKTEAKAAQAKAELAKTEVKAACAEAELAKTEAKAAQAKLAVLTAKLRSAGIDPDA